jgi:hypothetical protein
MEECIQRGEKSQPREIVSFPDAAANVGAPAELRRRLGVEE